MKKYGELLSVIGFLILCLLTALSYPESIKHMRGDYYLTKWVITETNKNWSLVFFLAICGGCIVYIVYKVIKLRRLRNERQ
jgi:hypothetical protein